MLELIGFKLECEALSESHVRISQPIMSVHSSNRYKAQVVEVLRRAKFKIPDRQKIYISKKWGFTKFDREVFEDLKAQGHLTADDGNSSGVCIEA